VTNEPTAAQGQAADRFAERAKDWRNGAVVYQVLVDRFAPSANLAAKQHLYPAPKTLRTWNEVPKAGTYVASHQLWSHEIDFWGGDLQSTTSKIDHVKQLGANVLYLNPIHAGYTNHKYDSLDFEAVSPEFGTRADVAALARALHQRGMKLVLDGVFNHMGRQSEKFKSAAASANSPWRDWFYFGPQYPSGSRDWAGAANLPELNLENPAVREHIWAGRDSVVRKYLREGVDGWRLDVAYDIGPQYLSELTQAAHAEKPGSLVVGEIWNYPRGWMPALDGIMNFNFREITLQVLDGRITPATATRMLERVVQDTGIEPLLKCWLVLDNHDLPRLPNVLPHEARRRLAQVLQFTLPGAPNVYYGSELGMQGGGDPEMRAPMRWDEVRDAHPELQWMKSLIALHQNERALKVGDWRAIDAEGLLAFERHTDRVGDSVFVVVNPTSKPVTGGLLLRNAGLMNGWPLVDVLGPKQAPAVIFSGMTSMTLPPYSWRVLKAEIAPKGGYTPYKRMP
jgi:cyclomaltodextrinase / maltogenic alpha-amylase / neopullulanase